MGIKRTPHLTEKITKNLYATKKVMYEEENEDWSYSNSVIIRSNHGGVPIWSPSSVFSRVHRLS